MNEFLHTVSQFFRDNLLARILIEYGLAIFVGALIYLSMVFYIVPIIAKYTRKSNLKWDDFLVKERLPQSIALILSISMFLGLYDGFAYKPFFLKTLFICGLIIVILVFLFRTVNFLVGIYDTFSVAKQIPIKNFGQLLKILLTMISIILIVSVFSGKSPLLILSGIGALSAILIFTFKDTIMSFIAGIQVAGLNIMSVGDWIEAPEYNADGEVLEVSLYTVKIQNWDKSISLVPLNKLMETNFKNWQGMQDSGGRRIKRSLYIDMNSVRNLRTDETAEYANSALLSEYIKEKLGTIERYNQALEKTGVDISNTLNIRRLTNVGTFRAYMYFYLKNHPHISQNFTLMVRQLQSTQRGLPLEVYAFVNNSNWVFYENTQADIFDHFITAGHFFGLKIFQSPSGEDFKELRP